MSKGIIFTIDATIALGLFLASLFLFYSFFIEDSTFGLRGAGIYTKTDDYLYIEEVNEAFSSVFNLYQKGDNQTAYSLLDLIRSQSEYPANIKMYLFELNNTTSKIYDISPNIFTDKLVFRRYASYSITRGLVHTGTDVNVSAPSTYVNKTINVSVTVTTTGSTIVQLQLYNSTDVQMPWTVNPTNLTFNAGTSTQYLNVTIPSNAWIDEYYAKAIAGAPLNQNGTDPFNVFRFGIVEMEVGI